MRLSAMSGGTRGWRRGRGLRGSRRLWRSRGVSRRGRGWSSRAGIFRWRGVSVAPRSPQEGGVPFLIASHWRAGRDTQFARAARLGSGIISISDYPDEYGKVVDRVEHHARALSRDPAGVEKTFYMTVNLGPDSEEAAAEADRFLKLYYGMNFWGDRWGPYGPSELTVERIRRVPGGGGGDDDSEVRVVQPGGAVGAVFGGCGFGVLVFSGQWSVVSIQLSVSFGKIA